jgi:hypothetical protein
MSLRLDWCSHEAAKYAVENWHYSRRMPKSKMVRIGVWELGKFIGALVFSYGATPQIGKPFGLKMTEICELTRVALTKHSAPVSRIVAIAIKKLRAFCPGLKLIVSYADLDRDHHGGIYQAGNWLYVGRTKPDCYLKVHGVVEHRKSIYDRYGNQGLAWLQKNVDPKAERIADAGKHKYLMPIDAELGVRLVNLKKPYPKRAGSKENVAPANHAGEGGATPTPALPLISGGI